MSFLGLGIGLALNDERGDSDSVNYASFPVGTPFPAGVLPGGGTYTQAAGVNQTEETVQTGASTVLRWAFVANLPRIGLLADGGIGLILEPPRTNRMLRSDALENASWFVESVAVTVGANATASPTGTVDAESVSWTAAALRYIGQTVTFALEASTLSIWAKASSGKIRLRLPSQVGVSNVDSADLTPTTAWAAFAHTVTNATTAGASSSIVESDAANGAMSGHMWGAQLEAGKYRTNWLPTVAGNVSRAGFGTPFPISRFVRAGKFSAEIVTVPFAACTDYDADSATIRLWTIDANTYAEMNTTTRVLTVSVNGVARVAGVPLWWLKGHRIAWSWEVGNGNLRVRYRLSTDQGATWTLPFDPFGGTVNVDAAISTVASSVHLWSDSGTSKWFGNGEVLNRPLQTVPAWALQWLPTDDANVKAWFRADGHYTLSGTTVSAWLSQTATAISAAQGTGASQPTYSATGVNGKPGLTFDGSNDFMTTAALSVSSGNLLVCGALNLTSVASDGWLLDALTGRNVYALRDAVNAGGNLGYYDGAWKNTGVAPATGNQILSFDLRTSPGGQTYKNGVAQGSAQAFSAVAIGGTVAIGSAFDGLSKWMPASLAGLIVASAPTDVLRRQIEAFLSAQTGIAVS